MSIGRLAGWFESHRSWCMDLLRIYLGIGLFVKGISFVSQREELVTLILEHDLGFFGGGLAHLVIMTHILGGALMAIGLGTRIGALIQVPSLVGATFFVHWSGGIFQFAEEGRFAALVLVLLLLFVWYGSGPLSLKARLRGT